MKDIKLIVYKEYFDFPLKVVEISIKDKTVNGRRLTSIHWADYVPEKHDPIIREHNNAVKQIKELEHKLTDLAHKL